MLVIKFLLGYSDMVDGVDGETIKAIGIASGEIFLKWSWTFQINFPFKIISLFYWRLEEIYYLLKMLSTFSVNSFQTSNEVSVFVYCNRKVGCILKFMYLYVVTGKWLRHVLSKYWILVCAALFLVMAILEAVIFRIIYMVLFLYFVLTFQVLILHFVLTFHVWILL